MKQEELYKVIDDLRDILQGFVHDGDSDIILAELEERIKPLVIKDADMFKKSCNNCVSYKYCMISRDNILNNKVCDYYRYTPVQF